MDDMTFGVTLRKLRIEAGFGLRALADSVQISPAYLSDIELGRRLPSDDVLFRLASQLGFSSSSSVLRDAVIDARIDLLRDRIIGLESRVQSLLRRRWTESTRVGGTQGRDGSA